MKRICLVLYVISNMQFLYGQSADSLLNGSYIITSYSTYGILGMNYDASAYSLMEFDGMGQGTMQILHPAIENAGIDTFGYSINDDGTIIFPLGEFTGYGIVSSDGKTFSMVVGDSVNFRDFFIGMKKSSRMSNSDLNGEYILADYESEKSSYALLNFNGEDSCIYENLYNTDGHTESGTIKYSVNDDGTFTIPGVEGAELRGIVSSDGESLTFVNADSGFSPHIFTGIRKSSGKSNVDLQGKYIITSRNSNRLAYILLDFDGNGNVFYEELFLTSGQPESGTVEYTVHEDGTFIIPGSEGRDFRGVVSSDRKSLAMVRVGLDAEPAIFYGIAKSDSLTSDIIHTLKNYKKYMLSQNYPNPFNPTTLIEFALLEREHVTLKVYNTLGKLVTELASDILSAGVHKYQFDGGDLASGIYYYEIVTGEHTEVKKMLLVR